MEGDLTSFVRHNYCLDSDIHFIHCRHITVAHVQINSFVLQPGSNAKMTDKHAAEYSKLHVWD